MIEHKGVINAKKALEEKREQQAQFYLENGYLSSVLTLLIEHFEGLNKEERR